MPWLLEDKIIAMTVVVGWRWPAGCGAGGGRSHYSACQRHETSQLLGNGGGAPPGWRRLPVVSPSARSTAWA
ncbi:hypothetical protein KCP76_00870 [Salmonella enterica subsp. enterica serovar Weltevreden]|nr:hypothetical protein KCP76_00870 [Salmonella enterica subsp. enterica serovar Weltevreden]